MLDTGVERALCDGAYAARRRACERVAAAVAGAAPGDASPLRDVAVEELAAWSSRLAREDLRRARHVLEEMARVEAFVGALGRGDLPRAGALMDASHASLRNVYEVSCPELDAAVELSAGLPGQLGARLTGAGLGGCAIALADRPPASDALCGWERAYRARTGRAGRAFAVRPVAGARLVPPRP